MKHHPVVGSKGFPSTTMGASSSPKANESKRRLVNGVDPARGTRPTKPHDVVTETTRKVNVRRSADSSPKEKPKVKEERKRVVGCRGPEKVVLERSEGGLKQRLEESDTLVGLLKVEVLGLKKNLEELQTKNGELEEQNRRYRHDLAAAEAKIQSFEVSNLDKSVAEKVNKYESIDDRLEKSEAEKKQKEEQACKELTIPMLTNLTSQSSTRGVGSQPEVQTSDPVHLNPSPIRVPPPPPPPPPPNTPKREAPMQKSPSLVEFYRSLTKRGRENSSPGIASCSSSVVNKAHNSVVGEIQNRSTHLLKIKEDVETKGEFINSLISKVQLAAFADIEEVSDFIEWLDMELSTLSDERAVLKHFSWPEKKADAMREAAFEYRALKRLQVELGTYEDEMSLSFDATLKKMENLLDKSERSTERLSKLRNGAITSYRLCKIPTDWMLDSGIINKVKLATMKLAKICMKRVPVELESMRHSEKEMFQEALLLQCVRFSYRVHQVFHSLISKTRIIKPPEMEFNSEQATRLMESEQSSRSDSPQQTAKPCINNCGFFINPGKGKFCSICSDDWQKREKQKTVAITDVDNDGEEEDEKKKVDRCGTCNKRLRLTKPFTCRCGESYCSTHRYPEDHDCKFDFKAFGRQSIARNNPIVRKDKIDRI